LLGEKLLTENCGARIVSNISLFLAFIESGNKEQATLFFVKTVPTLNEKQSRQLATAITVEQSEARALFVEATIFVSVAITN
jgi:hypothetical protein